jgi:hypothetical protein
MESCVPALKVQSELGGHPQAPAAPVHCLWYHSDESLLLGQNSLIFLV